MKTHLLQVLVIDHEALGADEAERTLEDARYPNDCISPHVIKSQSVDIGEWDDANPLNSSDQQATEVERLFSPWQPIKTIPKDGSHILVWVIDDMKQYALTVRFENYRNIFTDIEGYNSVFESDFTHWMPLVPPQG